MVGISLDGPREIHDRYRRDGKGNGTFDRVMQGLKLLQKHKVEYNVMACVARETATQPLEVYRFFRNAGVEFIQLTPIVERLSDERSAKQGLRFAAPVVPGLQVQDTDVTSWTVIPEEYGDFLIAVYEEWVRHDVGKLFVPIRPEFSFSFYGQAGEAGQVALLAGVLYWILIALIASALPVRLPYGSAIDVATAPILAAMTLGGPAAAAWVAMVGN